eukprot:g2155.t1
MGLARSLPGLRGGGGIGTPPGASRSYTLRDVGGVNPGPNSAAVSGDGTATDGIAAALGDADAVVGSKMDERGEKIGGDREEEEKGQKEEEEEEHWLDGEGSDKLPDTAPASQLVVRSFFLLVVFLFPMLSAGLAFLSSWFREKVWYGALTRSIGMSGTAFIKWGQWSSTRPDMFPEGLCEKLAVLHKGAPSHKFGHTKKLVERAFGGEPISEVFEWFEAKPMASGSVAQVHKAILDGVMVAVKVRHPKVKERMFLDFALMKKVANFADRRPSLKWMNLGPSMEQFSNTMSAQTDLVLEAKHLDEFNANFGGKSWSDCVFPRVIHCVEDVLVETFEEGVVVSEYAKLFSNKPRNGNPGMWEWGAAKFFGRRPPQPQDGLELEGPSPSLGHFIVTRGEDMWLKMVLNDGLLHADLHPGNILVHAPKDGETPPRLALVDAGMVAKLYGNQRRHFVRLLECLGAGDGIAAGEAVLQFSKKQTCVGEEEQAAFLAEMDSVFKERCRGYHTDVDVGDILRGVLTCVRRHSVRVDVEYATLILNILCLDSMGKVLLPTYNILDGAQSLLEVHKVGRKLVGEFGVKAVLPLARAYKWRQDRKFLRNLKRDTASRRRREQATRLSGSSGSTPPTQTGRRGVGSGGAGGATSPSAELPPATADNYAADRTSRGSGAPQSSGVGNGDGGGTQGLAAEGMSGRRDGEVFDASSAGGSSNSSSGGEPRGQSEPAGHSRREKLHRHGMDSVD